MSVYYTHELMESQYMNTYINLDEEIINKTQKAMNIYELNI